MREWIKRKVRQWAKLPAAAPAPRDSRPDNMVFTGGYQPKPGGKLGSPPTGGSAVIKTQDRAYNDPLTDMVTMGIIMSSAQDDTDRHTTTHHSHSSHDYGSSSHSSHDYGSSSHSSHDYGSSSSSYDSGSSYSDSGSSSSGGFD